MTSTRTVSAGGCTAGVTIHTPPAEKDLHTAVLYLHGGGLLYGERDDLPAPYIRAFTSAGYTLLCMDYPLAPEMPLSGIHSAVLEGFEQLVREEFPIHGIARYFLFGRSAGAYLALILTKQLQSHAWIAAPVGVLDFYGYYDMTDPFLTAPSAFYSRLPEVPDRVVDSFLGGQPVTSGPKTMRYSLYIHARQKATWPALLGTSDVSDPAYSLSASDIAALPPLFITASSSDEDVPYRVSKTLSRQAPAALMKTVYYLEHDFDRDTSNPSGMQVYKACLAWMEGILRK